MARVPLIDTTNPGCSRCGGHEFERMRVETYHDTAGYFHLSIYWQCVPCRNDSDVEQPCEVLEIVDQPGGKNITVGWRDDADERFLV